MSQFCFDDDDEDDMNNNEFETNSNKKPRVQSSIESNDSKTLKSKLVDDFEDIDGNYFSSSQEDEKDEDENEDEEEFDDTNGFQLPIIRTPVVKSLGESGLHPDIKSLNVFLANDDDVDHDAETITEEDIFMKYFIQALQHRMGSASGCRWNPPISDYVTMRHRGGNQEQQMADMRLLADHEYPLYYVFAQTVIFQTAMYPGADAFNNFDYSTEFGLAEGIAFYFFMKCFCNPTNGINDPMQEYKNTFTVSGVERVASVDGQDVIVFVNRSIPKFSLFCEPLVKEFDAESLTRTLDAHNIKGFRVWFFIHDPSIDPMTIIDNNILNNRYEAGELNGIRKASMTDPEIVAQLEGAQPGSPAYQEMEKRLNKENRDIDIQLRQMQAKRRIFQKEKESKEKRHNPRILAMNIQSRADYYNIIFRHQRRCLECYQAPNKICYSCMNSSKLEFSDANKRFRNGPIDPEEILFDYLDPSNPLTEMLESDSEVNRLKLIMDPGVVLNPFSPEAVNLLKLSGVEPEQFKAENYYMRHAGSNHDIFRFWQNYLVFEMPRKEVANMEVFALKKFPWIFSMVDLILDVLEKQNEDNARYQQEKFSTKRMRNKDYQEQVDTSKAYEDINEPTLQERKLLRPHEIDAFSFSGKGQLMINVAELNQPVITSRAENDFRTRFEQIEKQRRRLNTLCQAGGVTPQRKLQILEQISKEGLTALSSIFRPSNPNIAAVSQSAAREIQKWVRMDADSRFIEIKTVDVDIGPYGSNLISKMFFIDCNNGLIYYNHIIALETYFAIMRCSHPFEYEQMIGACTAVQNIVHQGPASVGKSDMLTLTEHMILPGTMIRVTSQSAQAESIPTNEFGTIVIHDELSELNDPKRAKEMRNEAAIAHFKEEATSFKTSRIVNHIKSDETNANKVRQKMVVITDAHRMRYINSNDLQISIAEISYWSRYSVFISLSNLPRALLPHASTNILPLKPRSFQNNHTATGDLRKEWNVREHALHVLVSHAIETGFLPYPNMELLGIYYNILCKRMEEKFPEFGKVSRSCGHVYAQVISKVISTAINLAFASEISPMIRYIKNKETGEVSIDFDHFTLAKLTWVAPYLFASEDLIFYQLSHMVLYSKVRVIDYHTLLTIATYWCKYNDNHPNYVLRKKPGAVVSDSDGAVMDRVIDYNYVQTVVNYHALENLMIQHHGYNGPTLSLIITHMVNFHLIVDNYRTPGSNAPPEKRKIPVVELCMPTDNYHAPIIDPISGMINPNAYLRISTEYLNEWSPKNVVDYVFRSFEHTGTRPRKVVVGDFYPTYPELLGVYQLSRKPGHILRVKNTEVVNPFILDTLASRNSVSRHTKKANSSMSEDISREIVIQHDIETELCLKWLKENSNFIPEDIRNLPKDRGYERFTPKGVTEMIRKRRQSSIYQKMLPAGDLAAESEQNRYPYALFPDDSAVPTLLSFMDSRYFSDQRDVKSVQFESQIMPYSSSSSSSSASSSLVSSFNSLSLSKGNSIPKHLLTNTPGKNFF